MFAAIKNGIVQCVCDKPFTMEDADVFESQEITNKNIGQRYKEKNNGLKVAFVTNWNVPCGISTFASYLVDELSKYVEVKIFAEKHNNNLLELDDKSVIRCWKRNNKMDGCVEEIRKYNPNIIFTNFEWGLINNGSHLLKYIQDISAYPNVFITHSVWPEHHDKNMILATMDNIIVHSE